MRGSLALCALSGVLLFLCFPPVALWPLAWVALAPWLVALRMSSRFGGAVGSWLGGFVFFGALLYWLYLFGVSVLLMVACLLGLVLMVWGLLARRLGGLAWAPRAVGTATLWCGVEWGRGLGQYGFTWGWLGYSQSPCLPLLSVARVFGTLGLSFLIVLVNAALAEVGVSVLGGVAGGTRLPQALARALVVVGVVAGCITAADLSRKRGPTAQGSALRVAVIQGSTHGPLLAEDVNKPMTAQEEGRALDTYAALTQKAAAGRPALVIWPESTLPGDPDRDPWIADRLSQVTRRARVWLVAGGPYIDARGHTTNAAYLYSPSGNQVARYDKVQLVPFGEYVPSRNRLPFLARYHVREVDFARGAVHRVLQAGTVAMGPMICFESIFPQISWLLARHGAEVLVVITNDAWFGHTAAAAQHRQIAVLRAVETGRWVLRGASTGISSIISPQGRIVAQAGLYRQAVVSADIRLVTSPQPGVRWGPVFAWCVFGLAIAFVIAPSALPGGRRQTKARAAQPRSGRPRPGRAAPR
jgi:apolipoprotein N-acyltransferase